MKLLLLATFCVVSAVVGGSPYGYAHGPLHVARRTNTELVALLTPLGEDLAVELAAKLEPIGIDFTAPVTEADPGKAWKAVEIVATTLVAKTVPAECGMAVAVHSLVGLTKHLVMNVIIEDMIHTGSDVGEVVRLQQMKVPSGTPAVVAAGKAVPGPPTAMVLSPDMVDVAAHIKKVVAIISTELEGKMAVFESVIGAVHMEAFFDDIHTIIDRELFLAKPVAELLQIVAITIQKHLVPFTAGQISCDVSAALPQIESGIGAVVDFLHGGFETSLEALTVPVPIKVILIKKLMITFPEVAEVLLDMVDAFQKEDLASFFVSLLKEEADHLFHGIAICQAVEHASLDGKLTGFIDKMVAAGKTNEIAKLILKITAMAMGDLELSPAEIKVVLTGIVDMVVGGTLTEVVYPQGKWFSLLVAILGAGANVIRAGISVASVAG